MAINVVELFLIHSWNNSLVLENFSSWTRSHNFLHDRVVFQIHLFVLVRFLSGKQWKGCSSLSTRLVIPSLQSSLHPTSVVGQQYWSKNDIRNTVWYRQKWQSINFTFYTSKSVLHCCLVKASNYMSSSQWLFVRFTAQFLVDKQQTVQHPTNQLIVLFLKCLH